VREFLGAVIAVPLLVLTGGRTRSRHLSNGQAAIGHAALPIMRRLIGELVYRRTNGFGERNPELLVNFKRFPPYLTGLAAFFRVIGDLAQRPQRLGFAEPVAELPSEAQGLGVVFACLVVLADEPFDLAEPAQRQDFAELIAEVSGQCQGIGVVFACLVVLSDESLNLTQPPQHQNFAGPVTELPGQCQGLGVVLAGLTVLADASLNRTQSPQHQNFIGPVTELPGQCQGLGVVLAGLTVLTDASLNLA
jgi:hypothetical protein